MVPVALVTDLKPGAIPERLRLDDLGAKEPILTFRHRTQVVVHEDLMSWHRRSNVVAAVLTMALQGTMAPADRARLAFLDLEKLVDAEEVQRLSPLVFQVGRLDAEEQERIKAMKSTLPEPHFFKLLKAEGKMETAQKLLEHGVSWDIITSSTGLKPADLKKAAKSASPRKLAKK